MSLWTEEHNTSYQNKSAGTRSIVRFVDLTSPLSLAFPALVRPVPFAGTRVSVLERFRLADVRANKEQWSHKSGSRTGQK
ncbi:hypothetical protein VTL71DRAFT_8232, partial [Oculimacula yallundae]